MNSKKTEQTIEKLSNQQPLSKRLRDRVSNRKLRKIHKGVNKMTYEEREALAKEYRNQELAHKEAKKQARIKKERLDNVIRELGIDTALEVLEGAIK